MYERHGVEPAKDASAKLRRKKGQTPQTRAKYRDAIAACDSEEYIHLNVSQVATIFHLNPTALNHQLRSHYPDIIPRREAERQRRGLADNLPRGVRKTTQEEYANAVELLANSDYTMEQVAEMCNVSFTGLRQYVIFYNKEVMNHREQKREDGKAVPKIGQMTGAGRIRQADPEREAYFHDAVEMYRTTSLSMNEIAERTGVELASFRYYMRMWHRQTIFERRGVDVRTLESDRDDLTAVKNYSKASAEKYSEAIELLRTSDMSTEAVARKFGFIPEVFRNYLKEHHPDIYESMGMIRLPGGRLVLKRSYERYAEAIRLYSTTADTLSAIAGRLNINSKSLGGFVRRNYPELIETHNRLVAAEEARKQEQRRSQLVQSAVEHEYAEKARIAAVLRQTDGNRLKAAALLGISRSTLYNKIARYGLK